MISGERAVKWLDAERSTCTRANRSGVHQRDRAEPANVAVVERSAVVEHELDRRIAVARGRQARRRRSAARP